MTSELPSVLRVESGELPAALPRTVGDIAPPLLPSEPGPPPTQPTTLFLTVDVEDAYFDRPILMTGDGIGREFGVYGIMDALDAHDMKGTFFVNVYEKDRQPAGVVESVVREIAERGHEVGLHSHPSPVLDLYSRSLTDLPLASQGDILCWGAELIEGWTGSPPASFRAGGYLLDDRTFEAMERAGIAIDSSCFFPSANNRNTPFTVNAVASRGSIVEVPITTVLQLDSDGVSLKHSKLDFNWLSGDDLMTALRAGADHGIGFAMFMMHSFSFIDKATRRETDPSSPRALFTSEEAFGCYVNVFGPRLEMPDAFASFVDRVATDPSLRVSTLRDAEAELRADAADHVNLIPLVSRP